MIISRTPFRISFFGGGTDYPQWYRENGGAVLATTIDKYSYISVRYLPPFFEHKSRIAYSKIEAVTDHNEIEHPSVKAVLKYLNVTEGVEIHHDGDLPARSGLGSSSSFTVGLINALMALKGLYAGREALAQRALQVEQEVIKEVVGSQDQVCAAYGGFNLIKFSSETDFDVNPVRVPPEHMAGLQNHLMLFFTGFSRIAEVIAKSKIANFKDRRSELKLMHDMVGEAVTLLGEGRLTDFGELLHETWQYKKGLSNRVTTPEIDEIYDRATKAGALGGKLLGAGGGGFMLLFVEPNRQNAVKLALSKLIHVPFRFENTGSKIV